MTIRPVVILSVSIALLASWLAVSASEGSSGIEEAVAMLQEGNARFASGNATHPNQDPDRLSEVASGQHPFAVIVGCSDSRVPPEIIFDQGIGDIFIIRTAGEVMDNATIGSIEYAVEHLGVPLVVVLGHDGCGAVKATIEGGELSGCLGYIVESIDPAVEAAESEGGDLLDCAIEANTAMIVEDLKSREPILSKKVNDGSIEIIGARYHLGTGLVSFHD